MPDTIGRITVPTPTDSGLTWALKPDFGSGYSREYNQITHRFGSLQTIAEQTYATGIGPRKFIFRRSHLSLVDRQYLTEFWDSVKGSYHTFTYNAPNLNGTTTPTKVIFETQPLSLTELVTSTQVGLVFVECPDPGSITPKSVNTVSNRFPAGALKTALLDQVQELVPLIKIRVREAAVPDILLSDRRITLSGIGAYLPRLTGIGESGASDVIMSQSITGAADTLSLTFSNADRVMTKLANDTDLKYATVEFALFHTNTGTLLNLWKGFVQTFQVDGSASFKMQCSDGLFQVFQQYPVRTISRQCWKTFNDGVACPFAANGAVINNDAYPLKYVTADGTQAATYKTLKLHGQSNSCDFSYDGENGCLAHSMGKYFGGIQTDREGIVPTWVQKARNTNVPTATSIVSDTSYGQSLPEIWCNDQGDPAKSYMANGIILAIEGGDTASKNADSEDSGIGALGIVGAGPIGAFRRSTIYKNSDGLYAITGPKFDGQDPVGFQVDLEKGKVETDNLFDIREVPGDDPAVPFHDQLGTTRNATLYIGMGDGGGWAPFYAAGTAFAEIATLVPTGTPSTPEQHQFQIPISKGLSGRIWNASGTASWVDGLTNAFWVAVNCYLRAIGLTPDKNDSADKIAKQLATFDLPSLVKGDGSGCAEIADKIVDKIVGTGTEVQFRFQGSISQQKPFRDWLSEILSCCLGYYTFEFGKLKLGIRENAGSVSAFTLGNMLYQSLELRPIEAAFEKLEIAFADENYNFQGNTANYFDKDHAAYYGRVGAPLQSRLNSVGLSNVSQALRVAATRVREEIGGINATEWKNARTATWGTTLLALDTEVGQVVSVTHPDIPGPFGSASVSGTSVTWVSGDLFQSYSEDLALVGEEILLNGLPHIVSSVTDATHLTLAEASSITGTVQFQVCTADFRITGWKLLKDWSIRIEGTTVTDSMFNLVVGPKPTDVPPEPLQVVVFDYALGVWAPYEIQMESASPLWPSEWTFDTSQQYGVMTDGTAQAWLTATGKLPENRMIPQCGPVEVGGVTISATGGHIKGGRVYRVAVSARDSKGVCSPPSVVRLAPVAAGTDTNSITIHNVVFPHFDGLVDYVVFVSDYPDLICWQQTGTDLSVTDIVINGPLIRSTWSMPNQNLSFVRLKAKPLIHGGVLGASVSSLPGGNQIVSSDTIDTDGTDNWAGRILMLAGRKTGSCPPLAYTITAFDASTGTFTLDRSVGDVQLGDAFIVSFKGYDNSGDPYKFTDTGISNASNYVPGSDPHDPTPHSGLTPDSEKGLIFRVIDGFNRGATAKIVGNTETSYSLDRPVQLDATSIVIVEDPTWTFQVDSSPVRNSNPLLSTTMQLDISNLLRTNLLVGGFTCNLQNEEVPDVHVPLRMLYLFGAPEATKTLTYADSPYAQRWADINLWVDATDGHVVVNLMSTSVFAGRPLVIKKVDESSHTVTINPAGGELIDGADHITLDTQFQSVTIKSDV